MPEKSGYEIRESLLHLAYQIVVTNAHGKFQATAKDQQFGAWPEFTVKDVVAAARELNQFVGEKSSARATAEVVNKMAYKKTIEG